MIKVTSILLVLALSFFCFPLMAQEKRVLPQGKTVFIYKCEKAFYRVELVNFVLNTIYVRSFYSRSDSVISRSFKEIDFEGIGALVDSFLVIDSNKLVNANTKSAFVDLTAPIYQEFISDVFNVHLFIRSKKTMGNRSIYEFMLIDPMISEQQDYSYEKDFWITNYNGCILIDFKKIE